MTVPVSLHDHIRLLASYGWGHEDICVRLKITGPARVRVRALVLGIDDDQTHTSRAVYPIARHCTDSAGTVDGGGAGIYSRAAGPNAGDCALEVGAAIALHRGRT